MLDKNFIYNICKEKINHFKSIDLAKLDQKLHDPYLQCIQVDPDKVKAKAIIEKVEILTRHVISAKNEIEQKKIIKNIIFNEVLTCVGVFPIILYPNQDDHNDLKFFPFPNISEDNLINYLKYLTKFEIEISKSGITTEKSFHNGAVIMQTYAISTIVYFIFKECAINLGIEKIDEKTEDLKKDTLEDILKLIPKINSDGNIDNSKIKVGDTIKTLLSIDHSKKYLEEDN
jgi:hypothetical protein